MPVSTVLLMRTSVLVAQRPERCSHLAREERGLFPRREVAALVGLVEVDEVRIALLDPAARGTEDLVGERGETDRERDRRRSLAGRHCRGLPALPVRPGRG